MNEISIELYLDALIDFGNQVGFVVGLIETLVEVAEGQSGAEPPDHRTFTREIREGRRSGRLAATKIPRERIDRETLMEALVEARMRALDMAAAATAPFTQ